MLLLVVSDLGALIEESVGDIRIKLERHTAVGNIEKRTLCCLYWSTVPIFMSPLTSSEVGIPISSI